MVLSTFYIPLQKYFSQLWRLTVFLPLSHACRLRYGMPVFLAKAFCPKPVSARYLWVQSACPRYRKRLYASIKSLTGRRYSCATSACVRPRLYLHQRSLSGIFSISSYLWYRCWNLVASKIFRGTQRAKWCISSGAYRTLRPCVWERIYILPESRSKMRHIGRFPQKDAIDKFLKSLAIG